ncbi:MAG: hypothetical protein KIT31_05245 [Deltaproteobacteria bacterium]|nr:hypothetical protein [Deltaproteobacteria bacterium]
MYKAAASFTRAKVVQPATTGGLSGLLRSLFGGTTPVYKQADGRGASAPASSSGLLGSVLGSPQPSYKVAAGPVVINPDDAIDENAGDGDDSSIPCLVADEVVLL